MVKLNMEKRADTSVAAIVAIVLGVVVVVFLIFGFSTGWGTLWDRITNTAGGSSNIDAVRSGCEVACLSKGTQQFCSDVRDVNYGKDAEDGVVRNDSGTCDYISKNPEEFPGLVVPRCSQISCPPPTP